MGSGALGAKAQTLSTASLSFGNWVVGTDSTVKTVTVTSPQTAPATINSILTSESFAETSSCPLAPNTLAAGAKCQIAVTFKPSVQATVTGTLSVQDSASNSPQTVQLSGNGVPPVTITPATLKYPNQIVNTSSTPRNATVFNNQTMPLTVTAIASSGDFGATSTCPLSPNTLAARTGCAISIRFLPVAAGPRSVILTVNDDAPGGAQTVALAGNGVPAVTVSPSGLAFSTNQLITTTSAPKTITLKNNQAGPLAVSAISAAGDFAQTSNCPISPSSLSAGSSCTISVTFTPQVVGARAGELTVSDNATSTPLTVSLSGTGTLSGLSAISVRPLSSSMVLGAQQQLTATGTFPNGRTIDISSWVSWSSSSSGFASVSATGLVKALATGVATISAATAVVAGQATVTVAPPVLISITISPANPSLAAGASQQFTAILGYSDGSTKTSTSPVSWSSSATGVANISASGLAGALTAGNSTIQASLGSVTGTTAVTVFQPSCTPPPPGLTGWWTGDGNTVDIAGNHPGSLQNGALYGSGEVAQGFNLLGNGASVLVNSTVYSPSAGTVVFWFLPAGAGALTGSYWGAQNRAPGFLIDLAGNLNWEFGNLFSQSVGQVNPGQWNHAALTYTTANNQVTVNVYLNGALVAEATAEPNTSWNPQVAWGAYLGAQAPSFFGALDEIAVFNQALTGPQIQQIYNAFAAGMCKSALQSIAVGPPNAALAPGLLLQFDAVGFYSDATTHELGESASWSTDDATVAAISGSGRAAAVASGNTIVSAALGSIQGSTKLTVAPSLASIQVNPLNASSAIGTRQPFTATGIFSDGNRQDLTGSVTWTSSNPAIATIDSNGLSTCGGGGQANITATAVSVSGSAQLTVTSPTLTSVSISPLNPTLVSGDVQAFTAMGAFSDGSRQDVTTSVSWSSSAAAIATVGPNGVANGLASGQAQVTATLRSKSGSTMLTVTTAILSAIQISPQSPSVTVGSVEQFSATGIYSDGTTSDVSSQVTWISSAASVATMGSPSPGLASGTGSGETRISANLGVLGASTTLIVRDQIVSIAIDPVTVSLAVGDSQQFTVTGTNASGITQDLTDIVAWNSLAPNVATVSATGLASSALPGQTQIEASLGSASTSANLMAVSPDPLGTAIGSNITCKGSTLNGTCYAVAISCPNTSDLTGYIEVSYPAGAPVGTVLFSTGANGLYLWELYKYGKTILNNVVGAGYAAVQISWGEPYTNQQPHGWQTGPGGIRAAGCRYATLAQWIYKNIHSGEASAPLCATGNSGGSEVVGLALAHYGLGSIFTMVEPTSGPPFGRQDWACDCPQARATNPCGVYGNFCAGPYISQSFIDPAYSAPLCSQEVANHSSTYDALFYHDSVVAPDSVFAYPHTFVKFLYGSLDSAPPTNQGHTWESAITSSKGEACVPNSGHTLPNFVEGAQQITNDIIQYCKLPNAGVSP